MSKDISAIMSGMGVGISILDSLVKKVKKRGLTDEDIHKLAMPEGDELLEKFADLIAESSNRALSKSELLKSLGTVFIPATTERFVVKEKFVVNIEDNAQVKISYLGNNFEEWFFGKVEEPAAVTTLRYAKLLKSSVDGPILVEVGDRAEVLLSQIFTLIEQQKNGESSVLLDNGYANIFYVRDASLALRAVLVDWDGDGWSVGAGSVDDPHAWSGDDQVFSRNS